MARRERRSSKRTARTRAKEHGRGWRHPGVWLATLSTVVGVATGMFTLRDQVFPRESGTAVAISVPAYQQQVGRVCDEVNDNDEARVRDDRRVKRELERARTPVGQRNALLDGVRRIAARSSHALVTFNGIETPKTFAAVRRETQKVWNRSLGRLRDYALSLERSSTTGQLVKALDELAEVRPALARESDELRSHLERLGAANCDLEPQRVPRTYTLPPLDRDKKGENRVRGESAVLPGLSPPPADTPAPPANGPSGPANPPADPPANPPANPPSTAPQSPAPLPPANPPSAGGGGEGGGGGGGGSD